MIEAFKRCSFLARSCSSHYQPSTLNHIAAIRTLTGRFNGFRPCSSSSKQDIESNTTSEEEHVKLIKLEIALISEKIGNAFNINSIQKHHWDELLRLKSKTARKHYYKRLYTREQAKLNSKLQKDKRKHGPKIESSEPPVKSTFLLRLEKKAINSWRNHRLFRAMQYGEKLIFDCSYDDCMTVSEAKSAATQLIRSFCDNRRDREPFDLHFCNVNFNSVTMKNLERQMPTMRHKNFPMNLHECSCLDLFHREELVYLTPHCDTDLIEYDPNMIYIVGAMVDKQVQEPLSFHKARELNVKMARLPLDRYLSLGAGFRKWLTLDEVVRIMLDLKRTGKWEVALQHVQRAELK